MGSPPAENTETPYSDSSLAWQQVPIAPTDPTTSDLGRTILAGRYRAGCRLVLFTEKQALATPQQLVRGFRFAGDPCFDHTGARLVFAGQRSADEPVQIWELPAATPEAEPRQLVDCAADCVMPAVLADGSIVFASLLAREYEEHGDKLSFSLYRVAPGAREPRRITFNPSSEIDPAVLRDGRIVFASWQHVANFHWPRGAFGLMLTNFDGTGVFPLSGFQGDPWFLRAPTVVDGDRLAFIAAEAPDPLCGGRLVQLDINNSFAEYTTLVQPTISWVADVAARPDGRLIVSAGPGGAASYGLYELRGSELRPIYDDPEYHDVAPAVGGERPQPTLRVSTVDESVGHAWLMALDCYNADLPAPNPLRPGTIARARILQGLPIRQPGDVPVDFRPIPDTRGEPMIRPDSMAGSIPVRLLGEFPVAEDGSFYAKVPADVPLRVQLLDKEGYPLVTQRAWIWTRPHERRVCIGCHENRELAPENRLPQAGLQPPADLTQPASWRTVTFRRDIQPRITANTCATAECHIPPEPTGGFNQSPHEFALGFDAPLADLFGPAYANWLARQEGKPFAAGGRRVFPGDSRRSPLVWMLYGRALAPQYESAPFERPTVERHLGPEELSDEEIELIRLWIDLGASFDDQSPPGPWPYKPAALPSDTAKIAVHGGRTDVAESAPASQPAE